MLALLSLGHCSSSSIPGPQHLVYGNFRLWLFSLASAGLSLLRKKKDYAVSTCQFLLWEKPFFSILCSLLGLFRPRFFFSLFYHRMLSQLFQKGKLKVQGKPRWKVFFLLIFFLILFFLGILVFGILAVKLFLHLA